MVKYASSLRTSPLQCEYHCSLQGRGLSATTFTPRSTENYGISSLPWYRYQYQVLVPIPMSGPGTYRYQYQVLVPIPMSGPGTDTSIRSWYRYQCQVLAPIPGVEYSTGTHRICTDTTTPVPVVYILLMLCWYCNESSAEECLIEHKQLWKN